MESESQGPIEVDLFISTKDIKVLNADTQVGKVLIYIYIIYIIYNILLRIIVSIFIKAITVNQTLNKVKIWISMLNSSVYVWQNGETFHMVKFGHFQL